MSTSLYGGMVAFADGDLNDDDPFDTSLARIVLSNINHLADVSTPVRVAWSSTASGGSIVSAPNTGLDDTYFHIVSMPFPLEVGPRAVPHVLRVRLAGASPDNTNTCTFLLRVSAAWDTGSWRADSLLGANTTFTTTSSTSDWISGDTKLTLDEAALDYLTRSTPTAVAGSTYATVRWAWMAAHVYGKSSDWSASVPTLTGLYVAEYLGP